MADPAGQPLLCQGGREPPLESPHGPRAGRTRRRPPGHQSGDTPGVARRPGGRLRRPRLRPPAHPPADRDERDLREEFLTDPGEPGRRPPPTPPPVTSALPPRPHPPPPP